MNSRLCICSGISWSKCLYHPRVILSRQKYQSCPRSTIMLQCQICSSPFCPRSLRSIHITRKWSESQKLGSQSVYFPSDPPGDATLKKTVQTLPLFSKELPETYQGGLSLLRVNLGPRGWTQRIKNYMWLDELGMSLTYWVMMSNPVYWPAFRSLILTIVSSSMKLLSKMSKIGCVRRGPL